MSDAPDKPEKPLWIISAKTSHSDPKKRQSKLVVYSANDGADALGLADIEFPDSEGWYCDVVGEAENHAGTQMIRSLDKMDIEAVDPKDEKEDKGLVLVRVQITRLVALLEEALNYPMGLKGTPQWKQRYIEEVARFFGWEVYHSKDPNLEYEIRKPTRMTLAIKRQGGEADRCVTEPPFDPESILVETSEEGLDDLTAKLHKLGYAYSQARHPRRKLVYHVATRLDDMTGEKRIWTTDKIEKLIEAAEGIQKKIDTLVQPDKGCYEKDVLDFPPIQANQLTKTSEPWKQVCDPHVGDQISIQRRKFADIGIVWGFRKDNPKVLVIVFPGRKSYAQVRPDSTNMLIHSITRGGVRLPNICPKCKEDRTDEPFFIADRVCKGCSDWGEPVENS